MTRTAKNILHEIQQLNRSDLWAILAEITTLLRKRESSKEETGIVYLPDDIASEIQADIKAYERGEIKVVDAFTALDEIEKEFSL